MLYRKNYTKTMIIENTVHFLKHVVGQLPSKSSHIEPKESRFESIIQLLKFIIISSIIKNKAWSLKKLSVVSFKDFVSYLATTL